MRYRDLASPLMEETFTLYHGTGTKFDAFRDSHITPNFFTANREYAANYAGKLTNSHITRKRGRNYLLTCEVTIERMLDTKTDPGAVAFYNETFLPHMNALLARFNKPLRPKLDGTKWVYFVDADDLWRYCISYGSPFDGMLVDEGIVDEPAIVPFRAAQVRILKRQIIKDA